MPIPIAQVVNLSVVEQDGLEKLIKRHQVGQQIALRARIVLAAARGQKNEEDCPDIRRYSRHGQTMAQSVGQATRYLSR